MLLGLFPLIAKKIVDAVKARQVYARWADLKPKAFDRNLVVIGAGAAGLVTSYIAAAVKAKVTLVEAHKMGGDCLNYGCVPSKALIRTATLARQMRHAQRLRHRQRRRRQIDFAQVMERVAARRARRSSRTIRSSATAALGVDVVLGHARIVDPWTVRDHARPTAARRR